jgi:hypothetical protein
MQGDRTSIVRLEVEVEPRVVLEFQRSLLAIRPPAHHDEGSHESKGFEVLGQFGRVPDLSVSSFKCGSGVRLDVDLSEAGTTDCFGGVAHVPLGTN